MVGRKREVECRLNVKKSLMISQQTKEKLRLKLKKFRKDLRKKKNNQNQSQKLDKALFTENKPLVFLFIYQEKQNVLFQFYHSLKVENHLFTRPPPTFI